MAFIAAGFTFSDNVQDQCSAANLNSFAASCLITGIAMSEFRTAAHVVQVSATTPVSDQGAGSLWFDTTLNILRTLDSTRWDSQYEGAEMQNSSGSTMPLGALVVASADNVVSMCATAEWPEVLGCLTATATNGTKAIIRRTGLTPMRCLGPLTYGDVLIPAARTFSADGWAKAATMVYGYTSFTGGIEIGMALGSIAGSTTGTVTCLAWR